MLTLLIDKSGTGQDELPNEIKQEWYQFVNIKGSGKMIEELANGSNLNVLNW